MRDVMLIVHFLGVAMGVGAGLANFFLGATAAKMEKSEGIKFMLNTRAISRMGQIGLVLLFVSGGYLMTPYWKLLGSMPLLVTKLVLFLILGALMGIAGAGVKRALKGDAVTQVKKITLVGRLALITSLTILILAVLIFH